MRNRPISDAKIAAALVVGIALIAALDIAHEARHKPEVRALTLKSHREHLPTGHHLNEYADQDTLAKELEKELARKPYNHVGDLTPDEKQAFAATMASELAQQVHFPGEKVVCVRYGTSGPPFAELRWRSTGAEIIFFLHRPRGDQVGSALMMATEFFAVPAETKVRFEPNPS